MTSPPPRPPSILVALRDALAELGARDDEHVVQALRRRILVYGSIMMSGGGLLWGLLSLALGQYYAAIIPVSYTFLTATSLTYLHHAKRFEPVRNFLTAISLLLPFLLQIALGGFASSGAMMMWAMIAIVAAITFSDQWQSALWLLAYLLLTVVSGFIDPYLSPWNGRTWSEGLDTAFLATNITLISSIVFGLAIYHTFAREKAILELLDERMRNRALVETLARTEQAAVAESEWMAMFLAKMSHEMRTPISAILGLTDVAMESESPAVDRSSMHKIAQVGKHLLSLVENLLDLFKISGGHMTLEATPFSLTETVAGLKTFAIARHRRRGVKIHFHLDPHLPAEVVGDALRLRQVLINLLANALKFTSAGQVVLSVTRENSAPVQNSVVVNFAVEDTGVGLTTAQINRLFTPFIQADSSTARQFGGTGLGLAISKEIANAFQSEIHVTSTPGQGSVFSLQLEFPLPARPPDTPQRMVVEAFPEGSPRTGRRFVLIDSFEPERSTLDACLRAADTPNALSPLCTYATVDAWFKDGRQFQKGDILLIDAPQWRALHTHRAASGVDLQALGICTVVLCDEPSDIDDDAGSPPQSIIRPVLFHEVLETLGQQCQTAPPRAGPTPPASNRVRLTRRRILLAEDNEIIRTTVASTLERAGAVVVIVENGQIAVDTVRADPTIDLILMDIQMPVLDGHQATRALRASGFERPIVGLSAGGFPDDRIRALAAGMNEHLTKPVDSERLINTIAALTQPVVVQRSDLGYRTTDPGGTPRSTANTDEPMTNPTAPPPPVFDRDALLKRVGGNASLVDTLIGRFVSEHARDAESIDRAASERHFDEVRFVAHRLKGAAKTMGAMEIAEAVAEIELRAVSQQDAPEARAALWEAIERFKEHIGPSTS